MRTKIIFLLLLFISISSFSIHNPVIWADVPDIDMIRVEDTYYMISTTMFYNPGAPIMRSKDLASWEIVCYVYDILGDLPKHKLQNNEHDYSHGQWAASIRYKAGTFYVFFASYGTGKSYIFKTNDIEHGTWTRSEINGMYHDASMLFDDDGKNYLVYGNGEIKIKELNSELTNFATNAQERTLFKSNYAGLSEGSHILKINNYYYVFIIAWPSGYPRIVVCHRSKSLFGQYENKIVLNSGVGTYGSGAAQGGIIDTPSGKWYGFVFQDHGAVGRIPIITPMTWQDDWPMLGINGKVPVTFELEGTYTGNSLAKSDDFNYEENKLALEWQWNHNPDNNSWSVTVNKGFLRLINNNIATHLLNARNTLTMRTEGPECSGFIKMDVTNIKVGDYAGLSAFQFNYGKVGVRVADDGNKKIYMAKNGGYSGNSNIVDSRDAIVQEVDLNSNIVYVKVDFKFNTIDANFISSNNIDKVNFYYSLDGNSWTKIGQEIGMTYDLKMFTGYKFGIYSYPTKNVGGYVDIDSFNYQRTVEWNKAN